MILILRMYFFRCQMYSLQRGCPRKVSSLLLNIWLSAVCWQLQHLRQLLVLWVLIVQFDATVSRTGATNQMTQKQPKKAKVAQTCCQRNVHPSGPMYFAKNKKVWHHWTVTSWIMRNVLMNSIEPIKNLVKTLNLVRKVTQIWTVSLGINLCWSLLNNIGISPDRPQSSKKSKCH